MSSKARPGGGKYGEHCERVLAEESAHAVVVIVAGGCKGSGFSVAARPESAAYVLATLPGVLRELAHQIEQGAKH